MSSPRRRPILTRSRGRSAASGRGRAPAKRSRGAKILVALAAGVLFALGIYLGVLVGTPPPPPDLTALEPAPPASGAPAPPNVDQRPAAASTGGPPPAGVAPAVLRSPPPGGEPRLAIVIDDLGRSVEMVDRLGALAVPLTYAVLPFEPRTAEVVAQLRRRGDEILCHLPMEAKGGADPGPGALRLSMDHTELAAATRRALAAVPGARGVNNHMGSGISSAPERMRAVLEVIGEHGLYYLDSRTSADTYGYTVAREMGLPAGERQVFLDTRRDAAFIRGQVDALLRVARERGGAIAIAHPYDETLAALAELVPRARAEGFVFVPASVLLDGPRG